MTPIVYDFLADLSDAIERKGVVRIHRIFIDFELSAYQLMHYTEPTKFDIEQQFFDCKNLGDLKLDLVVHFPVILEQEWLLWGGYFSVLYDRFQRLKTIDAILPTL